MVGHHPGRWLLSLMGLFTSGRPWAADYGPTHMFNDRWPLHARFHESTSRPPRFAPPAVPAGPRSLDRIGRAGSRPEGTA
jgi:hypothetical protein